MESWPNLGLARPATPAGPAAEPGSVQGRLGQARRHGAAAEAGSGASCEGYGAGGVAGAAEGVAPWIPWIWGKGGEIQLWMLQTWGVCLRYESLEAWYVCCFGALFTALVGFV